MSLANIQGKLERIEMKTIIGGSQLTLTGTRYSSGECYCDFMSTNADGSTWYICNMPCAAFRCSGIM